MEGRAVKLPPDEQLDVAAQWLRLNEGELGEAEACKAVADYLDWKARETDLRAHAREAGVPVALLRRKLAQGSPT